MTDIQRARNVLAKWREQATGGTWEHHENGVILVNDYIQSGDTTIAEYLFTPDARLIVGTAGNPELLDAIDGMLELVAVYTRAGVSPITRTHAERIAAVIVAADERMLS